jgi:hypothetical protein
MYRWSLPSADYPTSGVLRRKKMWVFSPVLPYLFSPDTYVWSAPSHQPCRLHTRRTVCRCKQHTNVQHHCLSQRMHLHFWKQNKYSVCYQSPVLHIIFLDNFSQPGADFLVAWIPAQPFVTSSDELSDSLSQPHMILLPFFASKNYWEAYSNFRNWPSTTAACLPRQYPAQTYHVPDHKPQSCTCKL